ncbi:uroporphyrinogen-III synthase [Cognatishimia sp. MH4019]|uniref:uroporphyrinogen-III synthase n=1 Tax=Cognatishimia sp. MH4019 TaxID=2854030 RepID=UPI001CD400CD|nr:uroporphyrinogen-III synthase [Cognatishimia sp. MH4019]
MSDITYDLILTRPAARSEEFAAALPAEIATRVRIHIAPVLAIKQIGTVPDLTAYRAVIFSSASAVGLMTPPSAMPAFCVGRRTTQAATEAGFAARFSGETADEVVATLQRAKPDGPLIHLHGQHTRGDIVKRLSSAGIETISAPIYAQDEVALPAEIVTLLKSSPASLVPLFSPRSATLFVEQIGQPPKTLHLVALSSAVAEAIPRHWGVPVHVADAPDAAAICAKISQVIAG